MDECDAHTTNAAAATEIRPSEVTPEQRRFAKLCAFGARSTAEALEQLRIALVMASCMKH